MPRAARRPTYSINSVNPVLLDLLSSRSLFAPLGSDNSQNSWQQNSSRSWRRAIKNAWLCFRMLSSFVGNNPSLQIHSFSEDRGKCNKTCNPSISDFSTILTSDIPIHADSSHLPSDEAYRQRLSLPCYRLSTPCYGCKPNARHFFDKIFIKAWFCWG